MKLGMVGLGRMGANMTARLLEAGHEVVAFDRHADKVQALVAQGAIGASSLEELVQKLEPPRAIDESVPAPILSTAIGERFASRGEEEFADRVVSAMRFEFAGHEEKRS
jgi:6-phosphogluconate dehydrogenase